MAHLCLLVTLLCAMVPNIEGHNLLLISMDGFRWDYIRNPKLTNLTSFHRMIADGGWAVYGTRNVFLTKTFPNHYTLVTGLYEESHGVVGNVMYDNVFNATYQPWNVKEVSNPRWYGGEPIWVTNQRQNTKFRSGSMMWPCSIAPIKGYLPYRLRPFDASVSFNERVDKIIEWFTDEYPINLGLLYFQEPDGVGHKFGPDSDELLRKLMELDQVLERLLYKLEDNDLLDKTDIILTSDHGMASIPKDESYKIDLNKYISFDSYFVTSTNPVAAIFPKTKELEDEIYKNLSGIPHASVYRKHDIPSQYHYTHHRRIAPLILEPEEHYWVSYNDTKRIAGEHGYNNSLSSMHPIFIAMGPSFKKGARVDTFNSVDVYPLMCKLLGLKPAPNNGSLGVVSQLLVDRLTEVDGTSAFWIYVFIIVFGSMVSAVFSLAACQAQRQYRRRQLKIRTLDGYSFPRVKNRYSKPDAVPLMSGSSEEEFNLP